MTRHPFLTRIPGRPGWYFQRAVPVALQKAIGRKTWRWKAGDSLQEARRAVAEGLDRTDAEIATYSGSGVSPALLREVDRMAQAVVMAPATADGPPATVEAYADDLWPRHSEDDQQRLWRRLQARLEGKEPTGWGTDDLLDLNKRLKAPAPSTLLEWRRHLHSFVQIAGLDPTDLSETQKTHAQKYRDHLLNTVAVSTAKTRLNFLRGLFSVAVEEEWISSNPFDLITKRLKPVARPKEVLSLVQADRRVLVDGALEGTEGQGLLYWIMRHLGTHVAEAAGICYEDIDLSAKIIAIRANPLRPLKNAYRERVLPITPALERRLQASLLPSNGKGHIFPNLYNPNQVRWGTSLTWGRRIGVSPKALRDSVASVLRDADVNERTIGAILGHTPKSSTGLYGSVSLDAKLTALMLVEREILASVEGSCS